MSEVLDTGMMDRYDASSRLERTLTGDDPLFFLHIPKAAGTSLGSYLQGHFHPHETFQPYLLHELDATAQGAPSGLRFIRGHFPYDVIRALLGRDPVCVTMLRDPVELVLSLIADFQSRVMPAAPWIDWERLARMPVEAVVEDDRLMDWISGFNLQAFMLAPLLPNVEWDTVRHLLTRINSTNAPGDLDRARQRLDTFAVVGITEDFQESLFLLSYVFGWPPPREAPRLNTTERRRQREGLPPHILDRLATYTAVDRQVYAHAQVRFAAQYTTMCRDLLARYGDAVDADLSMPLSHDALYALLEAHYTWRYEQLFQRPPHHPAQ
jgi:hypothetical protein